MQHAIFIVDKHTIRDVTPCPSLATGNLSQLMSGD